MDRRTFMKLMGGLASMPIVGRLAKPLKSETVQEGIASLSGKGMELYEMVVAKVMKEGKKIGESGRVDSYKHPDRPDITVDVNQTDGSAEIYFDTDKGSKGYAKIDRDMETGGDELIEAEEIYKGTPEGDYYKDVEEGISGGLENLDEFTRIKKNIGGPVQPYNPRASTEDFARAIDRVGAGTDMQKARAIQEYGQNVSNQALRAASLLSQPINLTGPTTRLYSGTTSPTPFGGSKFFATPDLATAKTYATSSSLRGSPFAGPVTGRILEADVPTAQAQNLLKKGLTGTREVVLNPQAAKTLFETGRGALEGSASLGTRAALSATKALPVIGGAASLADASSRFKEGDYVGAALGTAGAVPGLGLPALGAQVVYDAAKNFEPIQKVGTSIGEGIYDLLNPESATPTKDFSGFENSIITDGDSKYRINADGSRSLIGKIEDAPIIDRPTMADVAGPAPDASGIIPNSPFRWKGDDLVLGDDPTPITNKSLREQYKQYKPTMADVAGPATQGLIPGFTKLENTANLADGDLAYQGPDGQIYGPETYASIAAGRYPDIYDPNRPTMADVAGPAATGGGYAGDTKNVISEDPLGLIQQINKLRNGQTPTANYSYQPEEGGYVYWNGSTYTKVNPDQIKMDIDAIQGFKDGGSVDLTIITMPDISGSGVESLFKTR